VRSDYDPAFISVRGLTKSFRAEGSNRATQVIEHLDLDIGKGELLAIVGPNGCGKTTLLKIVAGLIEPDEGAVTIGGRPAAESRFGLMFQNYSATLFPWLKNIDNIGFVLDSNFGSGLHRRREYVREFVRDMMGLKDLPLNKYPYQCSGGQQQLVALARELAYRPEVLLLDEPFAALDYERRLQQHNHLLSIWQKTGVSGVIVSHDLDDALFLADNIAILSHRPASVVEVFEIGLPRPRRAEIQAEQAYAELRTRILRKFLEVLRS
jgi:NitT/TauT family transport system ATP-binding protein